ncbi:hypothetical protein B0H16DRAFT_1477943 [Mycena metata]|uniref:Uncharacterized protein n=1 Tax=Mycena metata TaxID=1033252 RepID=A0AAD7H7V5_9AGAR|nr:hypothetical protein B0H16DRAFT_1477943 [Mycena metata]
MNSDGETIESVKSSSYHFPVIIFLHSAFPRSFSGSCPQTAVENGVPRRSTGKIAASTSWNTRNGGLGSEQVDCPRIGSGQTVPPSSPETRTGSSLPPLIRVIGIVDPTLHIQPGPMTTVEGGGRKPRVHVLQDDEDIPTPAADEYDFTLSGGGMFVGSHHFTISEGTFNNVMKNYYVAKAVPAGLYSVNELGIPRPSGQS